MFSGYGLWLQKRDDGNEGEFGPMVEVEEAKLHAFIEKAVGEMGAAMGALLTFTGDRLGLFRAMAGAGPLTPDELARKTGTHPRIIREWLAAQAAGGYISYNAADGTFTLPAEHALALTDESNPAYIAGGYQTLAGLFKDEERIIEVFRTGKGLGWGTTTITCSRGPSGFSSQATWQTRFQAGSPRSTAQRRGSKRAAQSPFNLVFEARP